jgi:hypothetical protein
MTSTTSISRRVFRVCATTTSAGQGADLTDQYSGLLNDLTACQRNGLIAMLSTGFYGGWRPTPSELIRFLQDEYGITSRNHSLGIAEQVDDR